MKKKKRTNQPKNATSFPSAGFAELSSDPARKVLIAPSILSADFARLGEEIKTVEKAGADWIHVDVMDGHFVPNLTVGPVVVHWIRKVTPIFLDVHLMIETPWQYIPQFAKAGADSVTFHIEACGDNPGRAINEIRNCGKKVGVSLRPKTPLSNILPFLPQMDLVLIMTVEPGFGGQKFMPEMMQKVRQLKQIVMDKKLNCRIEVDGGINLETALITVQEGADVLVAGNSIFGEKKPADALKSLRSSIDKLTKK